jgi:hypothetical protein
MDDCASSVRKSAFQLLCDMIKKNPYGIKNIQVSLAEIESQYKKEVWLFHFKTAKPAAIGSRLCG